MLYQYFASYFQYEEPPKDILEQQTNAAKRLIELKKKYEK